MSATTFAGSAQFAAASILGAAGGIVSAIVAATLLNARYAPISVSMAPVFTGGVVRRLLESQLIVDESWAVSRRADGAFDRRLLVGAGLALPVLDHRHRRRRDRRRRARRSREPRSGRCVPRALPRPARPPGPLPAGPRSGRPRRRYRARPASDHACRRPHRGGQRRVPDRLEEAVSETWIVIVAVGTMTVALKAVGPVLLGGKPLPEHLTGIVGLLAPLSSPRSS